MPPPGINLGSKCARVECVPDVITTETSWPRKYAFIVGSRPVRFTLFLSHRFRSPGRSSPIKHNRVAVINFPQSARISKIGQPSSGPLVNNLARTYIYLFKSIKWPRQIRSNVLYYFYTSKNTLRFLLQRAIIIIDNNHRSFAVPCPRGQCVVHYRRVCFGGTGILSVKRIGFTITLRCGLWLFLFVVCEGNFSNSNSAPTFVCNVFSASGGRIIILNFEEKITSGKRVKRWEYGGLYFFRINFYCNLINNSCRGLTFS